MPQAPDPKGNQYGYRLLRYAPNAVSGEFYNVAVVLSDADGAVLGARFAPDLKRLACNPAVEMDYLLALRDEFEEQMLLGEGASDYLRMVERHLSSSLQVSEIRTFFGGAPEAELDRLLRTYAATPPGLSEGAEPGDASHNSRTVVRRTMQRAFDQAGLLRPGSPFRRGVEIDYAENLSFEFDYGYPLESGRQRLLHALGARNDLAEASRLCFVYERVRNGSGPGRDLTAVLAEGFSDSARQLLESSEIEPALVGEVDRLVERARADLGFA